MADKSDSLAVVAEGAGASFLGTVVARIIGYLFILVLARGLTRSKYGALMLTVSLFMVGSKLTLVGLDSGVVRYVSAYLSDDDKASASGIVWLSLGISLPLSLVFSLGLILGAPTISSQIFDSERLLLILPILALVIPVQVLLNILLSLLKATKSIKSHLLCNRLLPNISKLGFVSMAIFLGYGLKEVAVGISLSIVLSTGVAVYLVYRVFDFRGIVRSRFPATELLSYSWPLTLVLVLSLVLNRIDVLMIGYFMSDQSVGDYNIAIPLSELLLVFFYSLNSFLLPVLTELFEDSHRNAISDIFDLIVKWIYMVTFPSLIVLIVYPDMLVGVLFGDKYLGAVLALQLLAIGKFIRVLVGPTGTLLHTLERTKIDLFNNVLVVSINVILNYLLIPSYGIAGAAFASLVSFIILSMVEALEIYKLSGLHFMTDELVAPTFIAFGALIVSCVVWAATKGVEDPIRLGAILSAFSLAWLFQFIIIKPYNDYEKELLQKFTG